MNSELKLMIITDKELLEYLSITQKMLSIAKSELDLDRLKEVISALKSNKYEVTHINKEKQSCKYDYSLLSEYIYKNQNELNITGAEEVAFENYCSDNRFMQLAREKSYEELFRELSNNSIKQKNDISILFQYLTGNKTKSMNKERILEEIKGYIYKTHNFDDMNKKFDSHIK